MTKKVLIAMSGGVDSSVAALLMKQKGYEVLGIFMKNYSDKGKIGGCNWTYERKMAMKISAILKIPLITIDSEREYRKKIINKMFCDYKKGITPNPDVDCNQKIKFPILIKLAKTLGCDFVVTGHYARIKTDDKEKKFRSISLRSRLRKNYNTKKSGLSDNNKKIFANASEQQISYKLLRAKDESKDQSYFLYRTKESELKHLLFPIGNYSKKQVREIAKKNKFPNWDKKSTVGICFIGKVNLKDFLKEKIKPKQGKILSPEGEIIGFHDGIYYYTIGQRLGPRYGFDLKKPVSNSEDAKKLKRWYVAKKNAKKNIIIAAPEGHPLNYRKEIFMKNPHWINHDEVEKLFDKIDDKKGLTKKDYVNDKSKLSVNGIKNQIPLVKSKSTTSEASLSFRREGRNKSKKQNGKSIKLHARIRQVGELLPCVLTKEKKKLKVILNKAITGISEGQAIVLYRGKEVLGGGEIGFK